MNWSKYVVLSVVLFSSNIFSSESCVYDGQFKNDIDASYFNETIKHGILLSETLCKDTLNLNDASTSTLKQTLLEDWFSSITQEATKLNEIAKRNGSDGIELQIEVFNRKYFHLNSTTLSVDNRADGTTYAYQDDNNIVKFKLEQCKNEFGSICRTVVDEYKQALEIPWYSIKKNTSAKAVAELNLKSLAWQNYFEKRRSQTSLELLINTWSYQDELKKRVPINPPKFQWIVLHPSIVLQQSPDEIDGSQIKEALAIEWAGINYWDLDIPFGASIVSTYADRAIGKDFTTGLMFHISNDYSIGITHIGGENNVFISVDVMKLFEDKNSNFKSFVSSL
ncbi:hypothetical protein C7Y69_09455 [Alteromonas sp. KS69]|uniref:hypothetical protein n=1 Tax=Alteromonas sp. KS69 TaxID=2109917 RepID=UPI000F85E14E|nr:hypothetical protein [Alteromonas sp. KS69]RUP81361.1 hypothetical protein C7Y69_09455 [Alteromonas sp. KS69]|tara:strand:- start:6007 stop:7017 length:1011 start_codon:yes stop_codon:yes gene_type:complete